MGKVMRVCRVCGTEYEACYTRNTTGIFRWRDVACSVSCGYEYLDRLSQPTTEAEDEMKTLHEGILSEMDEEDPEEDNDEEYLNFQSEDDD